MLLHAEISVCTLAPVIKDEETDDKARCRYVQVLQLSRSSPGSEPPG